VHPLLIEQVRFNSPAVQQLIAAWNDELARSITGFSPSGGSVVSDGEFSPPDGIFLLTFRHSKPLGCVGLRRLKSNCGEIKRLYVTPAARGQGVGRRLLVEVEQHATHLSFKTLRLDADGNDPAALALFRSLGYQPIPDYNQNPYARHWFEKHLTSQPADT
jgi:GNAT superfamily N-acetyltransferase